MRCFLVSLGLLRLGVACSSAGAHFEPEARGGTPPGSAGSGGSELGRAGEAGAGSGGLSGTGGAPSGGDSGEGAGTGGRGDSRPFAPEPGSTLLLIGQSGRRAHAEYVTATRSVPAGGSVYAELYTGSFLNFEQEAFVDYLARSYPGSYVEVGLSWKDNRVNAGYCDLADAECRESDGAVEPELDIVAGVYDAELIAFGELLKSRPELRFLVRVDYEVSPLMHCRNEDTESCSVYGDAFEHVVWALRERAGVANAEFVFHPTRGFAKRMAPDPDAFDWIGFSVFNHDLCLPTPEGVNGACQPGDSLDPHLASDFAWAALQGKPIVVAESSVQKPSDDSVVGFEEYLERLFAVIETYDVAALTYINIKWADQFIYGEDWTTGAFGHVDARVQRYPETRSFFCDALTRRRYVDAGFAPIRCDTSAAVPTALPPDLDAPVFERLIVLGANRCPYVENDELLQGDCQAAGARSRFRFADAEQGRVMIWSDVDWKCWDVDGSRLVQRACSGAASQRFAVVQAVSSGEKDLVIVSADERCVGIAEGTEPGTNLALSACDGSPSQVFRP